MISEIRWARYVWYSTSLERHHKVIPVHLLFNPASRRACCKRGLLDPQDTQIRITGYPQKPTNNVGQKQQWLWSTNIWGLFTTTKLTLMRQMRFILFCDCYCPWVSLLSCNVSMLPRKKKKLWIYGKCLPGHSLPYIWMSYCECLFCFGVICSYQNMLFEWKSSQN